ncbi:6869_t:CDS:1 [Funneliformis geosporum]|uniref:11785_t:CDS:1 n=1 Tax=Funneliformis geosporum TaxID=1117311 RepID=A0A9W4X5H4_9GLOM|nr:11785_t:CDS:1 [Funneliformis geosporum]CAI2188247.1 6869_t:CDS:1 [Funneliformis geosporum]
MSWPKSLISSDWGSTTAIAPNGENVVVFANKICEVNPDGNYTQIGLEWPKIIAATTNGNFIYAIYPDGFIYKISTSSYTSVFKWAEAGGGWERAKAIFAYNDHIYVVRDSIWEIRLDGTYHMVQNDNWGATRSITVIVDYAYSVHDNGIIYKINLKDWTYRILSKGWAKTFRFQLLTLDNKLFAYDVYLTMVDTNTGSKHVIHKDNWNSKLAGCSTANAMYTAFTSGNLWKITKS